MTDVPTEELPTTFELVGGNDRVELTKQQVGALMADLNPARVATRRQGGKELSYVEAWEIKAALIRIFGFGGFSSEVIESRILDIRDDGRQGVYASGDKQGQVKTPYVMAYARVQLTLHGIGPGGKDIVYTEAAIGTNDGSVIGDVADNALKSAASDALKRCAINLGTLFGLSLYDNGSRRDVVKVLLQPEQAALLEAYRWESQPNTVNTRSAEQFIAALGATQVEPGVEAGQSLQDVTDEGTSGPPYPADQGAYPQQSEEM